MAATTQGPPQGLCRDPEFPMIQRQTHTQPKVHWSFCCPISSTLLLAVPLLLACPSPSPWSKSTHSPRPISNYPTLREALSTLPPWTSPPPVAPDPCLCPMLKSLITLNLRLSLSVSGLTYTHPSRIGNFLSIWWR